MKVIGAGVPRTGTLSQKVALEMLGFGPCYHMVWATYYGGSLICRLSEARRLVEPGWDAYVRLFKPMLFGERAPFARGHAESGGLAEGLRRYHEEVERNVPADRLLVWGVTEGWAPLCEFLDVDVPDAPFPRLNESKTYIDRLLAASLGVLDAWWAEQAPAPA
jgi:Sulfotransferase domain